MAQISLRVDYEVKRGAERTLNEIGLSMSTAINVFLKKVARENRIPFELSVDPVYSQENITEHEYNELMKAKRNAEYMAMLDESLTQLERGDTISFTLEELKAMESDDWKPTEKVLEFERKHGIRRHEVTE